VRSLRPTLALRLLSFIRDGVRSRDPPGWL